jgi:hypothetical protein
MPLASLIQTRVAGEEGVSLLDPNSSKCPEQGCEAVSHPILGEDQNIKTLQMLEIENFYLDKLVLRQVKRQEAQAATELEDDLVDVVPAIQRNKPQDNDSGLADDE